MKFVANIVSWTFIPLIFPLLTLIIVLYTSSDIETCLQPNCLFNVQEDIKFPVLLVFGLFLLLFPLIFIFILLVGEFIESLEMESSKERHIPILIMFFCCLTLYIFIVMKFEGDTWPIYFYSFPLSGMAISAIFFGLNFWKKISIHASGPAILTGFILAYSLRHGFYPVWPLALGLFLSGLIITARLYLEKHTIPEVLLGWGVAFIMTFSINYWYS